MMLLDCVSVLYYFHRTRMISIKLLELRDVTLLHYQCFFLWRSSKQLHGLHFRQERLQHHLYIRGVARGVLGCP